MGDNLERGNEDEWRLMRYCPLALLLRFLLMLVLLLLVVVLLVRVARVSWRSCSRRLGRMEWRGRNCWTSSTRSGKRRRSELWSRGKFWKGGEHAFPDFLIEMH